MRVGHLIFARPHLTFSFVSFHDQGRNLTLVLVKRGAPNPVMECYWWLSNYVCFAHDETCLELFSVLGKCVDSYLVTGDL